MKQKRVLQKRTQFVLKQKHLELAIYQWRKAEKSGFILRSRHDLFRMSSLQKIMQPDHVTWVTRQCSFFPVALKPVMTRGNILTPRLFPPTYTRTLAIIVRKKHPSTRSLMCVRKRKTALPLNNQQSSACLSLWAASWQRNSFN